MKKSSRENITNRQRIKKIFLKYICGQNDSPSCQEGPSKEEIRKMTSITEDPRSKLFLDINAVICVGVAVFLHGFWG